MYPQMDITALGGALVKSGRVPHGSTLSLPCIIETISYMPKLIYAGHEYGEDVYDHTWRAIRWNENSLGLVNREIKELLKEAEETNTPRILETVVYPDTGDHIVACVVLITPDNKCRLRINPRAPKLEAVESAIRTMHRRIDKELPWYPKYPSCAEFLTGHDSQFLSGSWVKHKKAYDFLSCPVIDKVKSKEQA